MLPVRRKYESAIEGLLPPVGRVNRFIRAAKRDRAGLQALSEGVGVRLMPVEK